MRTIQVPAHHCDERVTTGERFFSTLCLNELGDADHTFAPPVAKLRLFMC